MTISDIRKKAGRHKTLIKNFSYLSALQVFNMVLPLITYPYLIRVLGKETYGLIVFAQAVTGYLLILVGFGFNISATKEVSIHRDDKNKLSEIVSSVLLIKGGLFLLSMIVISALVFIVPQARDYKALFFLTMWMCLYDVIFPIWYFQGIEQMKYITYITLITRLTFLALIFVLIHSPGDYLFVPAISGVGALLAGAVSLYVIFAKHGVRFKIQPFSRLKFYFKDSVPVFVSNVSIRLYVSTNKVIVGAFLGMGEVAYYDLAEKITTVLKIPQSILSQSIFPKISKEKNIGFVKRIFVYSVGFNVVLAVFAIVFSKDIILLLGGSEMLPAWWVINILLLSLPVIAASNIFAIQLLIPFNREKTVLKVVVSSLLFYLVCIAILFVSNNLSIISLSIVTVIVELWVTIFSFLACKKYRIL